MKKSLINIGRKFKLGTDQIYPLIILAGLSFLVSLIPLPPNDFWWHLKVGEIIFLQGSIPSTNMFSWSINPTTPFTYGAWLGELFLFIIYRIGGLQLLTFVRSLLIILLYWYVGYETYLRCKSWYLASLAIAFIGIMTINNLAIRPQIFTWLLFIAFYYLLSRFMDGSFTYKALFLLPVLMLFWVNIHGSFILGGALIGIYFFGELIKVIFVHVHPKNFHKLKWLFFTGCLTGLAMLINPNGVGILSYVADLMTDRPSQSLIMEWQSPTPTGTQNTTFYISLLLLMGTAILSRYRLSWTESLITISFIWLAWTGQRYIIWYGITVLPILGKLIGHLNVQIPVPAPSRNFLNVIISVILFIPSLTVLPWFINRFPLPPAYWQIVIRNSPFGPLISTATPVEAIEYLRSNPGHRLFNEMGYGSYLIWALPEEKVFIDPRVELYTFEQWNDYKRISNGIRYNELLSKYGVERLLLDKKLQNDLVILLPDDSTWQLEYEDQFSQIWKLNP